MPQLNFAPTGTEVTPENGASGALPAAVPVRTGGSGISALGDPGVQFRARQAYDVARQRRRLSSGTTCSRAVSSRPGWKLPVEKQEEAIRIWLAAIAREFPDLDQIDVVNEPLRDPPDGPGKGNYLDALWRTARSDETGSSVR